MKDENHPDKALGEPVRLAFLDPIRVALTALVIVHHLSITYGGSGSWYYKETGAPKLLTIALSMFTGVNQAFFMGFFFLIAGYLMPASIARKGELAYLGERLLRLWLPLLLFGFLLEPLTRALADAANGGDLLVTLGQLVAQNTFGHGPLWFNQALLVFTLAWIYLSRQHAASLPDTKSLPLHPTIALATLGCGALAFCLRLVVPCGQNVFGMQIGYCASYLILFFGGAWAARERLLERVTWRQARPWLLVSLATLPTLWIAALLRGLTDSPLWRGGWNSAALHYAFWEPLVAVGIIMASLALARRGYRRDVPWVKRAASASYAAFVVHAPVGVACSWLVRDWSPSFLLRFVLAAGFSCILSFVLGDALTRFVSGRRASRPQAVPA